MFFKKLHKRSSSLFFLVCTLLMLGTTTFHHHKIDLFGFEKHLSSSETTNNCGGTNNDFLTDSGSFCLILQFNQNLIDDDSAINTGYVLEAEEQIRLIDIVPPRSFHFSFSQLRAPPISC